MEPTLRFRRSESVVAREVGGEQILLPLTRRAVDLTAVYVLNDVAKFVWERLDGTRTVAELVEELTTEFDVTSERALHDTLELMNDLKTATLIEEG